MTESELEHWGYMSLPPRNYAILKKKKLRIGENKAIYSIYSKNLSIDTVCA